MADETPKFCGMTYDRFKQLGEGCEHDRQEATEEIWAELLRTQNVLSDMKTMWYQFIGFNMPTESQGDRDPDEYIKYLEYLKKSGWGMSGPKAEK